ncbi:DUF488 domain-containing protein [Cryobacterium fucosi]|uniref:DUF488 family protein n=1 Tax=Cryobacterium fucosi TaxID=1259157 RepID=A0A4R9BGS2_9MICO|nr:DUF488 family protein [Cryobacterium fucosi]
MTIRIKRVYDAPSTADGSRVLVDRLWPRGVSRARADLDEWLKDVAPSPGLRTWWNHDPDRIDEFAVRYRAELDVDPTAAVAVARLRSLVAANARAGTAITLVYGARDPLVNHARILGEYLEATRTAPPAASPPAAGPPAGEHARTSPGSLPAGTPPTP